ncbi:UPF0149 family protein [Dyella sp.]|jgi:uncharacterized protein|uniref:UPF0149 family protein n=1 Tax=Dyella sp. TaxID=1869338 RepID=UPI002FDA889A
MKNLHGPLSSQELKRLDRLLLIGDVPEDGMILSSLDGYLTAIAVGPETVAPSEWLPRVFSESEPHIPQFESAKEGEEFLTLHGVPGITVSHNGALAGLIQPTTVGSA